MLGVIYICAIERVHTSLTCVRKASISFQCARMRSSSLGKSMDMAGRVLSSVVLQAWRGVDSSKTFKFGGVELQLMTKESAVLEWLGFNGQRHIFAPPHHDSQIEHEILLA
jgi:hypothetical protein